MTSVRYEIVEHDGGWAYKVGDVYSNTYASHDEALAAAQEAAREQRAPGETQTIRYQDETGAVREETADGRDRPSTSVGDA